MKKTKSKKAKTKKAKTKKREKPLKYISRHDLAMTLDFLYRQQAHTQLDIEMCGSAEQSATLEGFCAGLECAKQCIDDLLSGRVTWCSNDSIEK